MPNLPEKTDSFKSQDGLKIFYKHYPSSNEKARIVIAHGLAEHSWKPEQQKGGYGRAPRPYRHWNTNYQKETNDLVPERKTPWFLDRDGDWRRGCERLP